MKKRLYNLLKLGISAGLLVLLFQMFDFRASWEALRGMHLGYYAVAVGLFQLTLVLRSFRWRALLDAVDVHVPLPRLLYLYYVGVFFNTFLPSGFGGDAVKMVELARYSKRGSAAVGTVFLDRLAGIIMLFLMGLLAWPFTHEMLPVYESWLILIVSLVGLLATWALFQRRLIEWFLQWVPGAIGRKLQELYGIIHRSGTGGMVPALIVSAAFNLTLFALNYFIALALGVRLPFVYFVAFMPILSLSMLIPSVGALGTREAAYVLLFGMAGVAEPVAIAMSLGFYLSNVLTGVVGAGLYAVDALAGLRPVKTPEQQG